MAKDQDKDQTLKAKDQDKDQTLKAKDQDKDQTYKDKDHHPITCLSQTVYSISAREKSITFLNITAMIKALTVNTLL